MVEGSGAYIADCVAGSIAQIRGKDTVGDKLRSRIREDTERTQIRGRRHSPQDPDTENMESVEQCQRQCSCRRCAE